ncbi:hypothetical protein BaRGS_00018661, partial [Batillaria attramentaria]
MVRKTPTLYCYRNLVTAGIRTLNARYLLSVSLRRERVKPMSQGVSGSHDAAARCPNICVTSSGYVDVEIGSFSERSRDCGGSGYITLDDAADSTDNQATRQSSENMYDYLVPVDGHTYSTLQSTENEYERLAPADTRSKNVYSTPQFKKKETADPRLFTYCSFETDCDLVISLNDTWKRNHGYAYVDNKQSWDRTARFLTPEFPSSPTDVCLQFYYRSNGYYTGTLSVT